MKNLKLLTLLGGVALGGLMVSGCSTPDSRIAANPQVFAALTPQQQALVKAGEVGIGMTMDAVKLALGDPDRVTLRTTAAGQSQVWHYVTYEADGVFLYTGYYHHWHHGGGWGGMWGPAYPWYLDYPNREVHDRFTVTFMNGNVTEVSKEQP